MTIDKEKLKALAEAAIKQHQEWVAAGEPWPVWNSYLMELYGAANPATILALLAEIEQLAFEPAKHSRRLIDQLKAENEDYKSGQERYEQIIEDLKAEIEALRKALSEISEQVDENIRCTVRDVVNGLPDVQDIYGYCDTIDEIIDAAMAKEASHG